MSTSRRELELLQAAKEGDLTTIQKIITEDKTLVDCHDDNKRTLVFHAAWNGHLEIIKYLVGLGADINKAAYDKITPLMTAAFYGQGAVVSYLLSINAEKDLVSRSGKTALIYAIQNASEEGYDCVTRLLESKPNVDIQDRDGMTAIMHSEFDPDIFEALLEAKANLELSNNDGSTLFLQALTKDSLTAISRLRNLGVNVNCVDKMGNSALDIILQSQKLMNEKVAILLSNQLPPFDSRFIDQAINKAIEVRSVKTFKTLIDCGLVSQNNKNILAFAYHANMFDQVFSLSSEWKTEQITDLNGQSLLASAIQDKKYSIATKLIPLANVDEKVNGKSLLEIALKDNLEFAQQLINAGADVNTIASDGEPLLLKFIRDKKISHFLVQNGAETNIKSKDGSTLLMRAVEERREDLVNLILLNKPANLNDKNQDGRTALYIAAFEAMTDSRYVNILDALIKAEADPYVVCESFSGPTTVFNLAMGGSRKLILEYKARLEKKASITALIERGGHPLYHSANSNGAVDVNQDNSKVKGISDLKMGYH